MIQRYDNPFVNIGLIAPKVQSDFYDQYCQTQTIGTTDIDQTPFPRKVDLWFAGLLFAARQQLKRNNLKDQKTSQFNTGVVFEQDSWRIQMLMLIAVAVKGNVDIVLDPRGMMEIANSLAAAGVPYIVKMLREGDQNPIRNFSDALDDLFRSDIYEAEQQDSSTHLSNTLNEALQQFNL